jgi:predicted methyltransferase
MHQLPRRKSNATIALLILAGTISRVIALQDALPVNPGNPSSLQDFNAGDLNLEPNQRATDLVAALQISRGDWVVDVGAGAGYYSMLMSELVGPDGKVLAEDITIAAMGWLNARIKAFDLHNVEAVKGDAVDPRLPPNRLSAALIVDTYHHFTNHEVMLGKILQALKPGGRLVIADYSFGEHRKQPRDAQLKLHEIDPELVRSEVTRAGFRVVKCDDPFVKWKPGVGNARASNTDMWLLIAVRPE